MYLALMLTLFASETRSEPIFCLLTAARESNNLRMANSNLAANACWASFAVWKSSAGNRVPAVPPLDSTINVVYVEPNRKVQGLW
jgi:hypothetical protein